MNIAEIFTFLKGSIESKYLIFESNHVYQDLIKLDEHGLTKALLRIKRKTKIDKVGEKTVLFVELQNQEQISSAIKWSAIIKDSLLDPETFDLYLFIIFNNNLLTLEESIRIESSEHICKKYVQRVNENPDELISRTFLATNSIETPNSILSEPVRKALQETSKNHSWLTEEKQNEWKQLFISNSTGIELVDLLIPEISDNHEIH